MDRAAPNYAGNQETLRSLGVRSDTTIGEARHADEQEANRVGEAAGTGSPFDTSGPGPRDQASLSGDRLPPDLRAYFEPRLGVSLADVRIHTDRRAADSAVALGAEAYTVGPNIAFASGRYEPDRPEGRSLLAHELVHVRQQGVHGLALQRQARPSFRPPPVAPDMPPGDRLRLAYEQLDTAALPAFQSAVDGVNETAVQDAGTLVLAYWMNLEGAYQQLAQPDFTPADASAAMALVAPGAAMPAPGEGISTRLSAELQMVYDAARRKVLIGVSTQRFGGAYLRGSARVPDVRTSVAAFIAEQTPEVAWVVKDAQALASLLARPELPELDQWTAIGLLRAHLNPWNFSYMLAVVADRHLADRPGHFAPGPREAYVRLLEAQGQIAALGLAEVSSGIGAVALIPRETKVRILQPFTPLEIADFLYGDPEKWRTHLLPYNLAELGGHSPSSWLLVGTELIVDAEQLVSGLREVFVSALRARMVSEREGRDPYLWANPMETAVVGNTIEYGVSWPKSAFFEVKLEWWIQNDPYAIRTQGLPERVQGPRGVLRWAGENENTFKAQASAPGNHTIHCRLTYQSGKTEELRYVQTVMSLEEKTTLEFRRQFDWNRSPDALLEELRAERKRMKDWPGRVAQLDKRIAEIERTVEEADKESRFYGDRRAYMSPVRAVYVSAEESASAVPLTIFVARDPGYFDAPDQVVKLWDMTLKGNVRQYQGRAPRTQEALKNLFRTFADDAPYPKGNIRFEINGGTLPWIGLRDEIVTYPTDGGTKWAAALRGLSMVAMGVGVVSAFALQGEIAIPAFAVSGVLAGAAGAYELYDRLSHGDFEWDLQTGLDLLDIAGAVLTVGVSSKATAVARGAGRLSIGSEMQTAIGRVQLGIMAGMHAESIYLAVQTGDKKTVAQALLRALADGALVLIVHRAAKRLQAGPPRSRTMAGTLPPGGERPPGTVVTRQIPENVKPGTPEHARLTHEAWTAELVRTGLEPRPAAVPKAGAEPLPAGTRPERVRTPDEAYRLYEDALARTPGKEVGVFRNVDTGEYVVRVGDEMQISHPLVGKWEAVVHYHPNRANVLTHRMPAPADIGVTSVEAWRAGRPITEVVEFPIPGDGRGRTAYTVTPKGQVTIEFTRANGARVQRSFASPNEYQKAYGERTTYLDPHGEEYKWVIQDLNEFYGMEGGSGTLTAKGVIKPQPVTPEAPKPESVEPQPAKIETAKTPAAEPAPVKVQPPAPEATAPKAAAPAPNPELAALQQQIAAIDQTLVANEAKRAPATTEVTDRFRELEKVRRSPAARKDAKAAQQMIDEAERRYDEAVDRLKDVEEANESLRTERSGLALKAYYLEKGIRFPIADTVRRTLENHGFTNYDDVTGVATKQNGAIRIQKTDKGWVYTQKGASAIEYEIAPYNANQPGTDGFFQAHHLVQDAWAQQRLGQYGYKSGKAPTMLLRDSYKMTPHELITARQDARFASIGERTYAQERALVIADMEAANVPADARTKAMDALDGYFRELRNNIKDPAVRKQIFGTWEG